MNGKENRVRTLLIAVRVMFSATSPLARWLNKLAVGPPGDAANNIRPTASSGESPNNLAMKKQATRSEERRVGKERREQRGASSSRRRHTRFSRDWSSDVCSSDL